MYEKPKEKKGKTVSDIEKDVTVSAKGFKEEITETLRANMALLADSLTVKMNDLRPWYETKKAKLSDATSEILYSQRCRVGQLIVLTHVSALDVTTATTTTEIGIERGGELIRLNRDVPSAAAISVDWDGQAMLTEGDRVKVVFYVGTSADDIQVSFSGYEIKA